MAEERPKFVNETDETLLAVKGNISSREEVKSYRKKLGKTIYNLFKKHGVTYLRCIGAASVDNAMSAVIESRFYFKNDKVDIAIIPSYVTIQIEGVDKSAKVFEIIELTLDNNGNEK